VRWTTERLCLGELAVAGKVKWVAGRAKGMAYTPCALKDRCQWEQSRRPEGPRPPLPRSVVPLAGRSEDFRQSLGWADGEAGVIGGVRQEHH